VTSFRHRDDRRRPPSWLRDLFGLLRGRREPMGSPEVLERAKQRNRELEAQEKREEETIAHSSM
jgi:hypothetical protein